MSDVTPIRADVKVATPRKRRGTGKAARESKLKSQMLEYSIQVDQASALTRSMAVTLQDTDPLAFGVRASDGCLGIAELLEKISEDMRYHYFQSEPGA